MSNRQLTELTRELRILGNLLILNTLKSGATQDELAKLLGISDRQVRNILAGKG